MLKRRRATPTLTAMEELGKVRPGSQKKLIPIIRKIYKNYYSSWKGTTVLTASERGFSTMVENNRQRNSSAVLKEMLPHVPAGALRIPLYGRNLPQMLASIKNKVRCGTAGQGKISAKNMAQHMERGNRGPPSTLIFFPPEATKEIFTPGFVNELCKGGIKKRTLIEWSHDPVLIEKVLKENRERKEKSRQE